MSFDNVALGYQHIEEILKEEPRLAPKITKIPSLKNKSIKLLTFMGNVPMCITSEREIIIPNWTPEKIRLRAADNNPAFTQIDDAVYCMESRILFVLGCGKTQIYAFLLESLQNQEVKGLKLVAKPVPISKFCITNQVLPQQGQVEKEFIFAVSFRSHSGIRFAYFKLRKLLTNCIDLENVGNFISLPLEPIEIKFRPQSIGSQQKPTSLFSSFVQSSHSNLQDITDKRIGSYMVLMPNYLYIVQVDAHEQLHCYENGYDDKSSSFWKVCEYEQDQFMLYTSQVNSVLLERLKANQWKTHKQFELFKGFVPANVQDIQVIPGCLENASNSPVLICKANKDIFLIIPQSKEFRTPIKLCENPNKDRATTDRMALNFSNNRLSIVSTWGDQEKFAYQITLSVTMCQCLLKFKK